MDNNNKDSNIPVQFQYIDVSEPQEIRTEKEIIAEERAEYRKMLFKKYRIYLFIAIGVILVGLAIFFARMYHNNTNPVSKLMKASAKNFDVPFKFEMKVSEGDSALMEYNGAVYVNRSSQKITAYYDAKYTDYSYSAAVNADGKMYAAGNLYKEVWRVTDCEEKIHDFFDFDTDYRKGTIDAGAFLRFTNLNTSYSSAELQDFLASLTDKLSSESKLAAVTKEEKDGVTRYRYDFNLTELFKLIESEGAPIFYRSADYDTFKERFKANAKRIEQSSCVLTYEIDRSGYLTSLVFEIETDGHKYSVDLRFSEFGSARVELPEEFLAQAEKLKAK